MKDDECIFDGSQGKLVVTVSTAEDFSYIKFNVGDGFYKTMTDTAKIVDGGTIGHLYQDWLHEKLEAWIKENIKGEK